MTSATIDPSGQYAYFATNPQTFRYTMPDVTGHFIRVRLRDFVMAGNLKLKNGENAFTALAIDPKGQHAYLGTYGDPNTDKPAMLIRVSLSTLSPNKRMTFESGTYGLQSGIVSRQGHAAYWGTFFGEITGVSLPAMTLMGSVALQRDANAIHAGVIDPMAKFVYFGTGTGVVIKIDVTQWLPAASLSLFHQDAGLSAAAIDRAGRFSYWATQSSPIRFSRVDLEKFNAAGEILFLTGENHAMGVFLDEPYQLAYVITKGPAAQVIRIDLNSFERLDAHALPEGFGEVTCASYDHKRRKLYVGIGTNPARLLQIDMTIPRPTR